MGGKKVVQAVQVIETIDRLEKDGAHDEAEKLRVELNKYSVNRAHKVAREKGHLKGVNVVPPAEDDFVLIERWMSLSKEKQQATLTKPYDKSGFNFQETDGIEWAYGALLQK